jgi:hypothetical protein
MAPKKSMIVVGATAKPAELIKTVPMTGARATRKPVLRLGPVKLGSVSGFLAVTILMRGVRPAISPGCRLASARPVDFAGMTHMASTPTLTVGACEAF